MKYLVSLILLCSFLNANCEELGFFSRNWAKLGCSNGDIEDCKRLGEHYALSNDESDQSNAIDYFNKACLENDKDACFHLGELFLAKDKGFADTTKALEYFDKGCLLNNPLACHNNALNYLNGLDTSFI